MPIWYLVLGILTALLPHPLWEQAFVVWIGLGWICVMFEFYANLKAARRRDAEALDYNTVWASVTPPGDEGREPYVGETVCDDPGP